MATYQRGKYWWYRFRFAGERIDEPTKSTSRTVAKDAERQHRKTLEAGYNNFKEVRQNRVRILEEIIDEYLTGYRLRYRSATFAEYALGHVSRLLGTKIVADITGSLQRVLGKRPEHTHIVIEEVDPENWGFAGMLTSEWRARAASQGPGGAS